jgi:hypothetical protein
MASVADLLLQGFTTKTGIHDYQHASKLYVGNNYQHGPKSAWLYHVSFQLDPTFALSADDALTTGLLVKNIDLPKFTVEAKTVNSYNRPTVVQSKIKYDAINVTFHDDNADSVLHFWATYYGFYYRDSDLGQTNGSPNQQYLTPTKYGDVSTNPQLINFGYTPRGPNTAGGGGSNNIIKSIKIYSLHQKVFTEYILVNPTITSFKHGTHNNSNNTGTMEHQMTVAYEAVLYGQGAVGPAVDGFATIYYDKAPSPLSPLGGGTKSILGPGGLLQTASEVTDDISNGNYLTAGLKIANAAKTFNGASLGGLVAGGLASLGQNIIAGNNPLATIFVPNQGNLAGSVPGALLQSAVTPIGGGIVTNGSTAGGLPNTNTIAALSVGAIGVAAIKSSSNLLGKLFSVDKTGTVTGSGNLPTQTPAEEALSQAEGGYPTAADAEANQQAVLDAYNQDQAAAAQAAADNIAAANTDAPGVVTQSAGISLDNNPAPDSTLA